MKRRGKCAGMVGIAADFPELPNEVVSRVRESLILNFWSSKKGEPKRAKLLLAKIEQKLKVNYSNYFNCSSEPQIEPRLTYWTVCSVRWLFWKDTFWFRWEFTSSKFFIFSCCNLFKHGLAFHSERQVQGKPTCLLIEDTNETDDQIRVLDIIMTEDWKSGRAIDGEFKEIHLMHYYEHYLENFSTLLFNGQTIHRIGPPKSAVHGLNV